MRGNESAVGAVGVGADAVCWVYHFNRIINRIFGFINITVKNPAKNQINNT